MTSPRLIKVGGSLLDWPELPRRLARLIDHDPFSHGVLLAGGGGAANWVRLLDRVHGLGDQAAHALAIRALDLTAHALATMAPGLEVITEPGAIPASWRRGLLPVLAPGRLLRDESSALVRLPASWDLTSDSIAAWLCGRLGLSRLLLLKSAPAPRPASIQQAAAAGLVDPLFPRLAQGITQVSYWNLRDPEAQPVELA